ncbi:MAG: phosphate ABC transporter permease subunit PstC [Chthonomonas sp.]|nr:phosphate ABC transporter permease subunit PstC [Chthonomonas sp.]
MAAVGETRQEIAPSRRKRRLGDLTFRGVATAGGLVLLLIVVLALQQLFSGSREALAQQGGQFFYGSEWDSMNKRYGALPLIWGTFVSAFIALLVGGVTGVTISAFLVELAPKWLYKPVSFLVDLLAAIPSIIFGLWGMEVLIPWLRDHLYPQLTSTLGWTGLFGTSSGFASTGYSLLTAGIVLGVMIIPTVAAITREMLLVVPKNMRDGALALGANRTEALKGVMIPFALGGILGGLILGLGRALGETMAVTMIIGNTATINKDLLQPAATLSSQIATNFGEADGSLRPALIGLGFLLFLVTLSINMLARWLVMRMRRRSGMI